MQTSLSEPQNTLSTSLQSLMEKISPLTQPLGLETNAGQLTTSQKLAVESEAKLKNNLMQPPELSKPEKPKPLAIRECLDSQNQLSILLAQTYAMQHKFGEQADLTGYRDAGFQWLLGDYSIEQVRSAFEKYLKQSRDLPSPSDIIKIIDPPPEPMSAAVYVSLKRRSMQGELMFGKNLDYIRRFESIERARSEGKESLEEFYRAEKEVKALKSEYGF